CSEPDFWDAGSFYEALSTPTEKIAQTAVYAAAAGVAVGVAAGALHQANKKRAVSKHQTTTLDDLGTF
ncbi:MAG: Ni/Fe hydrogenase, partial [Proteobacteria bacterium]|nr:Ni/Fe hydrogenase [Pseudomonadota bacterium]